MKRTSKLAIAGAALVSSVAVPAAAWAQVGYTGLPTEVRGTELRNDPNVLGSEVSTDDTASSAESGWDESELPVTGGDLVGLAVIGLGAVGAGTLFVRRGRRTT